MSKESAENIYTLVHETVSGIHEFKTYPAQKNCLQACKIHQPNVLMNGKELNFEWQKNLSIVYLKFHHDVVFRQKLLSYDFSNFLIDMGSSLGLWFGLSVFGIMYLGFQTLKQVQSLPEKVSEIWDSTTSRVKPFISKKDYCDREESTAEITDD